MGDGKQRVGKHMETDPIGQGLSFNASDPDLVNKTAVSQGNEL